MNTPISQIRIPSTLLPRDGRFGAGPARIRPAQLQALQAAAQSPLGTSHRQAPVKNLVRRVREGLTELYSLPEDYEVILGNGGASALWDALTFSVVRDRAAHAACGEFSAKFATATKQAPFLKDSVISTAPGGELASVPVTPEADVFAWAHNETSTGVLSPVTRPASLRDDDVVVVDGTSAAGGVNIDIRETDIYYFSGQKNLGTEGGLWIALVSPRGLARIENVASSGRWIPSFLDMHTAVENSRKNQTLNTPAITTLLLLAEQVEWILGEGGLQWAAERTSGMSTAIYDYAATSPVTTPFVHEAAHRSPVVCTIDLDETIDAAALTGVLRTHGIVDIEPYRKLGRNQVRIATFVSVEPSDVEALLACLDYVLNAAT